jgi:hypothetical protein
MQAVNQHWFDRHDALPSARGASAKSAIVDPNGTVIGYATTGGIAAPQPVRLMPGTRIVRFGKIFFGEAVGGPWWLEWRQYRRIEAYADQHGLSIQLAVRRLCCVALEWSTLDVVIQARLKSPLMAYSGVGAPVVVLHRPTHTREFLPVIADGQGSGVSQLFIPGLGNPDVRHDALMIEGHGYLPVQSGRQGYIIRPM